MAPDEKLPAWAVLGESNLPYTGLVMLVMIDGKPAKQPDGKIILHPIIWN